MTEFARTSGITLRYQPNTGDFTEMVVSCGADNDQGPCENDGTPFSKEWTGHTTLYCCAAHAAWAKEAARDQRRGIEVARAEQTRGLEAWARDERAMMR
jgi:hypothetical protein